MALELGKVVGVDLLGEAKGGIDDGGVKVDDEVLGDGAGTWVIRVEAGDGDGGLAVQVLLEVDRALGEDGTLELGQGGVELGGQAVLQHEARQHLGVGDEGQEFAGARVDVRCVETAGLEEDARGRDAEVGQDGEVFAVGQVDLPAVAGLDCRVGCRVEVELEADGAGVKLALNVVEAVNGRVVGQEFANKPGNRARVGRCGCNAQNGR